MFSTIQSRVASFSIATIVVVLMFIPVLETAARIVA